MNSFDEARERYEELFSDDKAKAAAFDKLATHYYFQNFSTFPKAEIDLLMFSEYLDRSYQLYGDSSRETCDYALSKRLGITQSRIAALKERKEIKYPSDFNWREVFAKELGKADFRDGRIRIYAEDSRFHNELCNVIRELGGYSETTLTKQLVVVSPATFIDLMVEATEDRSTRDEMRELLAGIIAANDINPLDHNDSGASLSSALRGAAPGIGEKVILAALKMIPGINPMIFAAAEGLVGAIAKRLEGQFVGASNRPADN